jgi:hypothetical protein
VAATLRAGDPYWAEQTEILRLSAEAWAAEARGQREQGINLLREAAEREARTDKHPVTPGPLMPAREQLGEMLLLAGRHAEAEREFLAVQETEPRRFRAVHGAARAAELAGHQETARAQYAQLLEIVARADPGRPEIEQARAYLARR